MQVVHIDMYDKPSTVNLQSVNYHPALVDTVAQPWRDDIKPLHVIQPQVGWVGSKAVRPRPFVSIRTLGLGIGFCVLARVERDESDPPRQAPRSADMLHLIIITITIIIPAMSAKVPPQDSPPLPLEALLHPPLPPTFLDAASICDFVEYGYYATISVRERT